MAQILHLKHLTCKSFMILCLRHDSIHIIIARCRRPARGPPQCRDTEREWNHGHLHYHNGERALQINRSQSKMSSDAITPSREQLKRQTSRLIEELESTWNDDVAFSSPLSIQRRSPRRNGKTTTRRVNFELGPSSNSSEGGDATMNNSDMSTTNSLLKSRRSTPCKPVVDARLALSPPPASTCRKAKTVAHREALKESASAFTPRSSKARDDNSVDSLVASDPTTPSKGEQH